MRASTMRSRRGSALGLAVILAASASAAGCSSEPKDPATQREERVEARIESTFSRSQAACIMKVLDGPTIAALDRSSTLPADSEALRIYSNAVVACTA
ncbi:MAG: hypothetical protein JWO77_2650 [Ilumatobacteraceae bacterium]|nr:hypothetical protein [Ilumatobacteraceae bacterium]